MDVLCHICDKCMCFVMPNLNVKTTWMMDYHTYIRFRRVTKTNVDEFVMSNIQSLSKLNCVYISRCMNRNVYILSMCTEVWVKNNTIQQSKENNINT